MDLLAINRHTALFGWVQLERIEDQNYRYVWWVGNAWFNPYDETVLCLPIPFNWIYRAFRTVFETVYWPTVAAKRNRIKLSILRNCLKGTCVNVETDEMEDRGYSVRDLVRVVRGWNGDTMKDLLSLHQEWVGRPYGVRWWRSRHGQ